MKEEPHLVPCTAPQRTPSMVAGCLVLIACLIAVSWGAESPTHRRPFRRPTPPENIDYPEMSLSPSRLADALGETELLVLDARERSSYLAGHIPGSVSIPPDSLHTPTVPEELGALVAALGRHGLSGLERFVCLGDSSYSTEAALLVWLLEVAGAERVSLLEGGAAGWDSLGLALVTEEKRLPATTWEPEPRPDRLASRAYVEEHYGESGFEIIDTRGKLLWEGAARAEEGASRARRGHIPHSLSFDFHAFFLPGDAFRAPAETRAIFSRFGPRLSSPVNLAWEFIVHGDGVSSEGALGYFFLRRAGIKKVRFYPGGWIDWSSEADLPVVRFVSGQELADRLAGEGKLADADETPHGFILVDVRHSSAFVRGHIPGAINLYSNSVTESLDICVEQSWPHIDRSHDPVVTYCYGPKCIRSRHAATMAARLGFMNVERFYGGIEEWEDGGLLTITKPQP